MVSVKLRDIEDALESSSDDWSSYVNKKTGSVEYFEDIVLEFIEEYEDLLCDPDSSDAEIEELIEENRLNDVSNIWDAKRVRELAQLEYGMLVYVEPIETREQYRDMEDFIATIEDDQTKNFLYIAIDGQGAFRRFKDALATIGKLQDYYDYKNSLLTQAAKEWCEDNGISYEE